MRRPPVVLIIIAVLLTGVSVGWAAGSDADSPSLGDGTSRAAGDALALEAPELSTAEVAAPAPHEAHEVSGPGTDAMDTETSGPEPVEALVENAVVPLEVTSPPAHLEEKAAPVEPAPEPVAEPSPATTTVAPAPEHSSQPAVAFSAGQLYGSCDEPIPYDIFSGTAEPGSTVTISSAYGSGTTTSDGSGHWERKVEFAAAPRGSTFDVTVAGVGGSRTFAFTVGH